MTRQVIVGLGCWFMMLAAAISVVVAQEEATESAAAVAEAPQAPISMPRLKIELRPMTQDELVTVATEWMNRLESVAKRIRAAELAEAGPKQLRPLRQELQQMADRAELVLDQLDAKGGDATKARAYLDVVRGGPVGDGGIAGFWTGMEDWLYSPEGGGRILWNVILFIITIIIAVIIARILGRIVANLVERNGKASELLKDFLVKTTRRTVIVIGFIVALTMLGLNVGPLVAAIGGIAFIVAFALQGTLSNFASGIMILMYRPFDVGDVVDVAGESGVVESMNLVSTHIKTFDNQIVIIPNNSVWGSVITNVTGKDTRRVDLTFGIGYSDDIGKAIEILRELAAGHELTLDDPALNIQVMSLGDSSVNLICRPWCKTEDYWTVYWDLMRGVKERFDAEDITIPFPQRDVHLHQAE